MRCFVVISPNLTTQLVGSAYDDERQWWTCPASIFRTGADYP